MSTLTGTSLRLTGRTIPRSALTPSERDAMFALLSTFFTGVDVDTFDADLSEKSHVILLEDDRGVPRGFSTLLVYRSEVPGVDAMIVYSGDTIVDKEWWGSPALPVAWLAAARSLTSGASTADVYWLLLTSGFRTYRFLPVFWREFYPRFDSSARPKTLVDALAAERFGERYDAARGIVRFAKPQVLVPELLDVPSGRLLDEHVAFFLDRNPGYSSGDELVCLTNIGDANLTAAGRRIARSVERLTP
ncbi:MAG TPA: hypothetical protein VH740_08585 [Vicinamibacterales bacterium]|jgi:hypothetical protein